MTHRHAHDEPGVAQKCVDLDPQVCLEPMTGGGAGITSSATGETVPEYFAGFLIGHDRDGFDVRCEGFVRTHPEAGRPMWSMTGSLEGGDLTVNPSILCRLGSADVAECGFHGWVREGKWVPA